MDIAAFHRGETEALRQALERILPWIWRLARSGCVLEVSENKEKRYLQLKGTENPDTTAKMVADIAAAALTPKQRKKLSSPRDLGPLVLQHCQKFFLKEGEQRGKLVTISKEQADSLGLDNLNLLIDEALEPQTDSFSSSEETIELHQDAAQLCRGFVEKLDERGQQLIQQRFLDDCSDKEVAQAFDCGAAAVRARERKIRRQLKHRLVQEMGTQQVGNYCLDAYLTQESPRLLPPNISWERLRQEVLTRTFTEEPASYGSRLLWGLGASAIAAGLWTAMLLGYLPHPDDDPFPSPAVKAQCEGGCAAGKEIKLAILAPRNATHVAITIKTDGSDAQPLLVNPGNRSLSLPFGSKQKLVPISYPGKLPSELGANNQVVAVFSEEKLSLKKILDISDGRGTEPGVLTSTTALAP